MAGTPPLHRINRRFTPPVYHAQVHGRYYPHNTCPEGELRFYAIVRKSSGLMVYYQGELRFYAIVRKSSGLMVYYQQNDTYVDKTKDMVISFHKQPIVIPPITPEGMEIDHVKSVKLLGIIVTDKVTWNENTTYICSKASKRLYHLKQLRRAGLDSVDLLAFYGSVIRPVLE